jgi:hypothetical protein
MEIEITKPTPEAAELQSVFNQTDKETISLLMKEVEELYSKLEAWQKCSIVCLCMQWRLYLPQLIWLCTKQLKKMF